MNIENFDFRLAYEMTILEFCQVCEKSGFTYNETKLLMMECADKIAARIKEVMPAESNPAPKAEAKVEPVVSDKYEVGAILYDSWGWEQTNIDFYCIVARKGDFVTVLPMKCVQSTKETSFMSYSNTPGEIDWTATPQRKKVKVHSGKEAGFSFRNYSGGGWCSLWDGTPKTSSHYA